MKEIFFLLSIDSLPSIKALLSELEGKYLASILIILTGKGGL